MIRSIMEATFEHGRVGMVHDTEYVRIAICTSYGSAVLRNASRCWLLYLYTSVFPTPQKDATSQPLHAFRGTGWRHLVARATVTTQEQPPH